MTPKRAVAWVNTKVIRPRSQPSPAQVEAFLAADGWEMVSEERTACGLQRTWEKRKTPTAEIPHQLVIPERPAFDSIRRVVEVVETIALMKGDRWAVAEIMETLAKIKVPE